MAMEFSPLYMRRLSGSSTRNSFNEDALEQLEFNINDISRASSPASVTSTSARSEGHGSHHSGFSRDSRHRGSGRAGDEYRRKYNRMKHELELERVKARQLQQERVEELRKLREAFENDQRLAMTTLQKRMDEDKKKEMVKLKEELIKQKDFELQQVLMYKESERKGRGSVPKTENKPEKEEKQETGGIVEDYNKNKQEILEDEDDAARKDADNDIAIVSKRPRAKEKAADIGKKPSISKTADSESEAAADVFDGGTAMQFPKNKKSTEVNEPLMTKEVKARTKSERKDNYVGRIVSKIEMNDATVNTETNNTAKSDGDENVEQDATKLTVKTKDESLQTSMILKADDESQAADKQAVHDMEFRIKELESHKAVLEKEIAGVRQTLDVRIKEHKIKEDEFIQLRAGYDRELRTVINEHKKVALGNLDKLKMAEEALKQATLTDEEIASLSQRHERKRKLSTSSLPALNNETKKEDREREKNLQKKLGELTTQIQRLERRIALLRTENDALRKKQDDHRPLEDKIKTLKKRNSELASIARRLEEKAKTLQQENTKVKSKSSSNLDDQNADSEHVKRLYARQRAKELAEHAKIMLAKENEVDDLRKKCQQLADKLGSGELLHPQNAPQFEEKEELVNIIKQAAKERLQLEQQLAHIKKREKGDGSEDPSVTQEAAESLAANEKQRQELIEANEILHQEIQKLEKALEKTEHLEQRIIDKTDECSNLTEKLTEAHDQTKRLEKDLRTASTENAKLTSEVKGLKEKVKNADEITEECNTLKVGLNTAQKEREAAQEEVEHLNRRVRSLENLVRDLQESAEQVGQIEHERQAAILQLQETKTQIGNLRKTLSQEESEHQGVVTTLNKRVEELEEKRRKEEERREELSKEVQRLKEEAEEKQRALEAAEQISREALEREQALTLAKESPITAVLNDTALNQAVKARGTLNDEPASDRKKGMDRRTGGSLSEAPAGESFLSSWVQNGPIQVYIAKYNYDPFEYSPNENPEAELPLSAGDYVLVVGEMDEDGFFDGELIDGRQGLVPSNFIEKVEDEDLAEFHAALMEAGHRDYSNSSSGTAASTTTGHNRTAASEDSIVLTHNNHNNSSSSNNNNNNNTSISNNNIIGLDGDSRDKLDLRNGDEDIDDFNSDLEDIAEIDEETASINSRVLANGGTTNKLPPCPRGLSLDRQLSTSLLISWKEPEPFPGLEVHSYHVLLDGQLKTSVKSSERTKALLECVNASDVHRVCVQCLSNRGQSKDAQCTMLVGKDVYPKPSDLKISHQSPTSAVLSWLPGSSNYQHSVLLNGKEVRTVKPGTFRYTLTGLSPGSAHQVTLIAKSISGTLNEEKSKKWMDNVSASIKFFTPEAGCPEAPLNVQVENGPRSGTLLLTWLPVTINASGVSNGNVVSGYHIMSNGRRVKTVSGATADHVVLNSDDFQGRMPNHLSIRTICTSGVESSSSDVIYLPPDLATELLADGASLQPENSQTIDADFIGNKGKSLKSGHEDPKGHDTDEEIEAAFREIQSSPFGVNASIASEPYSDSSGSELSDIPEVEEELVGSHDSNLNQLGKPMLNQAKKESPRPSPRTKGVNQNKTSPQDFHSQKPSTEAVTANRLAAPGTRVVPAIEITRDSGSDRGASLDEETDRESSPSRHNAKTQSPDGAIGSRNSSAFRQVDPRDQPIKPSTSASSNNPVSDHKPSTPDNSGRQSAGSGGEDYRKKSNSNENSKRSNSDQTVNHQKQSAAVASPPTSSVEDVGGDTDSISGEINVVNENSVRLFIALFDYDPETMSPNVDSIDEELPFREGQILKVYGDKDADGFYKGETQGRIGFVPCNMVSEVQIDDADLVEQLLKESMEMGHPKEAVVMSSQTPTNEEPPVSLTPNGVPPMPREKSMRKMIAMYDYDPQELSPNVDAELELSFKTGDLVYIFGDMDEDGFYNGEISGRRGLVPSNFLQSAPHSDEEGVESDSVVSAARSRSGESLATSPKGDHSHRFRLNNQQSSTSEPRGLTNKSMSGSFSIQDSDGGIQPDGEKTESVSPPSPTDDDKQPKKKAGFFSKSKNIFKKLTR